MNNKQKKHINTPFFTQSIVHKSLKTTALQRSTLNIDAYCQYMRRRTTLLSGRNFSLSDKYCASLQVLHFSHFSQLFPPFPPPLTIIVGFKVGRKFGKGHPAIWDTTCNFPILDICSFSQLILFNFSVTNRKGQEI